jgi:hypothetical protein
MEGYYLSSSSVTPSTPSRIDLIAPIHAPGTAHFRVEDTVAGIASLPSDDWRADVIRVADMDEDTWPDLVLGTDSVVSPSATRSHVRSLISRPNDVTPAVAGRRFEDVTDAVMPPVRVATPYSARWSPENEVIMDSWRARDLWVGDLDGDGDRPDIVLTHDELKDEPSVYCKQAYSSSPIECYHEYGFYWGGTRRLMWLTDYGNGRRMAFDHLALPMRCSSFTPLRTVRGPVRPWCSPIGPTAFPP